MRREIKVEFDPSNEAFYVFCIEVCRVTREMAEDAGEEWVLQPYGFPTLGAAMSFVQPQIASPLAQPRPGEMWEADLKSDSALEGIRVRICQLVMVL